MADTNTDDVMEQELVDKAPKDEIGICTSVVDRKESDKNNENHVPLTRQEEEVIKKKYGGIIPKKPPLISMDHERAYFDSADWALGKHGAQKPKGPLEALRPKLQPTKHQQARSRRSSYAPTEDDKEADHDSTTFEDQSKLEGGNANTDNTDKTDNIDNTDNHDSSHE